MKQIRVAEIAKKVLPNAAYNFLRKIRNQFKDADVGPPVVQIYVCDGQINTYLALNDFYGFLVPLANCHPVCELEFFDSNGKSILKLKQRLSQFAAEKLDVKKTLSENSVHSQYGIVTLRMLPHNLKHMEYKRMGMIGSFFYVFYEHENGSVGQVHPSSILDPKNKAPGNFLSNQAIAIKDLLGIRLMQANPSLHAVEITHSILDIDTGQILMSQHNTYPPLGVRIIDFDFDESSIFNSKFATVYVDPLPSSNSKPVLVRKYSDRRWSYSHS